MLQTGWYVYTVCSHNLQTAIKYTTDCTGMLPTVDKGLLRFIVTGRIFGGDFLLTFRGRMAALSALPGIRTVFGKLQETGQ